jgi:tetratricopeptide (TPR) repeat protein
MFDIFKKLFRKDNSELKNNPIEEKGITKDEVYSFKHGINLSGQGNYEAALAKFDIAIGTGIFNEAYRERAYCLQILNFHLDAIDDFSSAIELFPQNANNYYGRSLSKGSLGYYDTAIDDIKKAIELSLVDSKENFEVNQVAIQKNIMPPTPLYKDYLEELTKRKNETNEQIKQIYISPAIRRN